MKLTENEAEIIVDLIERICDAKIRAVEGDIVDTVNLTNVKNEAISELKTIFV